MKPTIENLGKVSVTVEKEYWTKDRPYDRLTIVHDTTTIASYISRQNVPAGMDIFNTEYWIPLGRVSDYLEEFVEEERGTLRYLETSVRDALAANQEFYNTAWQRVESKVNNLDEIITNAINTINSNNTTFETNENDRKQAETIRVTKEDERNSAEALRQSAEALRQSAEDERQLAEEKRQYKYTNEYDVYENNRNNAEKLRNTAESARQEQEDYRITNEETRQNTEAIRQGNENVRISSENSRQQGEQARVIAENGRITAEDARVVAENNRQLQEGNDSDEPNANGSRWARYKAAENIRQEEFNESQTNNSREFNEAQTIKQEAYDLAETERWNSFTEAETIRDKEIDDAVAILDTYETTLNNKANVDGSYSTMTVGAAETLLGSDVVTAKYTYRSTAGTADVADGVAKISSVKGNTIVWNQLIPKFPTKWYTSSNTISTEFTDNLAKLTIVDSELMNNNGESVYCTPIQKALANHKYLIKCKARANSDGLTIRVRNFTRAFPNKVQYTITSIANTWQTISYIDYISTDYQGYIVCDVSKTNIKNGDIVEFKDVQVFDLTQMFDEGNEPTIEEFEAMFPNDYYEYNEGELRSIEDFSIKSVGFNQINQINKIDTNTYQTDYIRVLRNTNYYVELFSSNQSTVSIMAYDKDKNYIGNIENRNGPYDTDYYFTPQNNVYYIICKVYFLSDPINFNIAINISHSGIRDGEYEPYQENILPINISTIEDENGEQFFPNGLCSAGEAHDELVYDKGIGKWKAIKRIGSADMATLPWSYNAVYDYFSFSNDVGAIYEISNANRGIPPNLLCSKYPSVHREFINEEENKDIKKITQNNGAKSVIIKDTSYTDAISFRESLQGQILYYELAEPIEVVLDDFTSNYQVSDWGTEEILMNTTPIVPVIYDVEYALNAVDTLRNMPTNYISKESLNAFLSVLGTAMGGTWTATYNESNNRYDFTFNANTNTTELVEE